MIKTPGYTTPSTRDSRLPSTHHESRPAEKREDVQLINVGVWWDKPQSQSPSAEALATK
jgi:hypothetical protein